MKKEPFVSIVICTRNRANYLEKFALKSIKNLNYLNYEVIVIDDDSIDNTLKVLQNYKNKIKNLRIIRNKKSRGLCYVRNIGVKNSKGEIIVFVDDDCIVHKNWLKELIKPYLKDKNIKVVGGKIYIKNSKKLFNLHKQIYGCNMSFKREIFNTFLFDENLKYPAFDEVDLIDRIKRKGLKTFYSDKAKVYHFIAPSMYRKDLLGQRLNHIYFLVKRLQLNQYYYILFTTFLFGKKGESKLKRNERKIKELIDGIRGMLSPKYYKIWPRLPLALFYLIFKIPIKAKLYCKL